jgi:hypothetical protein
MEDASDPKPEPVASSEPTLQPKETELATNPKGGEDAKGESAPVCVSSSGDLRDV